MAHTPPTRTRLPGDSQALGAAMDLMDNASEAASPATRVSEQPVSERESVWRTLREELHPSTVNLVVRFARALAAKLAAAEKKYGYSDGWRDPAWMDECRVKLLEHVAKGDPLDVAAYCAFLWFHGKSTAGAERAPLTDEQIARLRQRYTPPAIPPCRVCGGPLSIGAVGGGQPTVWACSGQEADPDHPGRLRRQLGRGVADEHYSRSRWEDRSQGGDSDVIALLDALSISRQPSKSV